MNSNIVLKSLTLTNFRNINHATYDLKDASVFVGKNFSGKTNCLLAIYWLFTDKMLDGSKDSSSIKPKDNTRAEISVEITFTKDNEMHAIKKTFKEKWTTARGSAIEEMSGHTTTYSIDGISYNVISKAQDKIAQITGIDINKFNSICKLDVYQLLTNPFYVGEIIEWKELRKLVFSIIGDITNEDIIAQDSSIEIALPILIQYKSNTADALKKTNQDIKQLKDNISALEISIKDAEEEISSHLVSEEELRAAEEEIKMKRDLIYEISQNKENPEIAQEEIKLENLKLEMKKIENEYKEKNFNNQVAYASQVSSASIELQKVEDELRAIQRSLNNATYSLETIERDEKRLRETIVTNESYINSFRESYLKEKAKEFTFAKHTCPNCAYQLNSDEEESELARFNSNKEEELKKWQSKARDLKNKNEETKIEIANYEIKKAEYLELIESLKAKISTVSQSVDAARIAFEESKKAPKIVYYYDADSRYVELKKQFNELTLKIARLKEDSKKDREEYLLSQKTRLESEIKQLSAVKEKKVIYDSAVSRKETKIALYNKNRKEMASLELIKQALTNYENVKLSLMHNRVANVFGDIDFVLVEQNIKEGSWNSVCYPCISGKNVEYRNGSSSERVITGVKLIEIFKKELDLVGLPILVDECGQFDNIQLAKLKELTSSQIIATRPNEMYESPTVQDL